MLDEATANIDTATEQVIQRGLRTLPAGRTSFVIARRLATITRADNIVVLEHGRIWSRARTARCFRVGRVTPGGSTTRSALAPLTCRALHSRLSQRCDG